MNAPLLTRQSVGATCSVDGCSKPRKAKGYCDTHYARHKAGLSALPPIRSHNRVCEHDGCDRPHGSKGYCHAHYKRAKTGLPMHEPIRVRGEGGGACSVEGCDDPAHGKGLCRTHYGRAYPRSPEANRAKLSRRRHRAVVRMTVEDRALSVEYRRAIEHDSCYYCGRSGVMHDDHKLPLSLGGTDHWYNLCRACSDCNLRKGTMTVVEWVVQYGAWWWEQNYPESSALTMIEKRVH
ncbi:HNH endonuclease [Rhodococcus sp. P1Y]|uniref:HNH endonuclease n=1 Tax=Rhodococcus sp. P1Y TaxID=1302308 RepID=UPI00137A93C0|nr:HNH endonuclease [Rhodococcus sp. P1Y]